MYSGILGDLGAVSGGGNFESLNGREKNLDKEKSRPFGLFPTPTNCPRVSKDFVLSVLFFFLLIGQSEMLLWFWFTTLNHKHALKCLTKSFLHTAEFNNF